MSTKLDPTKFKVGPVPIQSAEDAAMAYLRDEISEDELREAYNQYGVLPGQLVVDDSSFVKKIPDALKTVPEPDVPTVEERMKAASAKTNAASANEKTATPVGEKK